MDGLSASTDLCFLDVIVMQSAAVANSQVQSTCFVSVFTTHRNHQETTKVLVIIIIIHNWYILYNNHTTKHK
jgi:hypothetical protein